jgi:hypothetical protein
VTVPSPLFDLLPAVYRLRDADREGAMQALVEVLEEQADVVERDIEALYDNWFIETCEPWVVQYLGDLLGVRPLAGSGRTTERAARGYVANTLAYRRRKGTAAVLEQLALDVTSWRARAVEGFLELATTQHANHVRLANVRTPDVRRLDDSVESPFARIAHTAEVRPPEPARADSRRGRYNIPYLSLFLWRLQAYRVEGATPRPAADAGTYTFDPLGLDVPLFNLPRTEEEITGLARETDVPHPLRRRPLYGELEARRQAIADGAAAEPRWFRAGEHPFRVSVQSAPNPAPLVEVPPERITVCDLSGWQRPGATASYRPAAGGAPVSLPLAVAVDPELGRLAFPSGTTPVRVEVDYAYGFSGDAGAGPYDHREGVDAWIGRTDGVTFHVGVTKDRATLSSASVPNLLVSTVRQAVTRWKQHQAATPNAFGLITIMDSATYDEDLSGDYALTVGTKARLAVVAAGWPDVPGTGRTPGRIAADERLRPHLRGDVSIRGTAPTAEAAPGSVHLAGLLIEGPVAVLAGNLGALDLIDCTVAPGAGNVTVSPSPAKGGNARLRVAVDRSITGPVTLPPAVTSLTVGASIVDAGTGAAITAPGARAAIERSTVFGTTGARVVEASDSIFTGDVVAGVVQDGCVRFSALPQPPASRTSRRYRCQPDMALQLVKKAAELPRRRAELRPAFTSTVFGEPGYAQLATECADEIRTGAEDGSEMGVFGFLEQPQREANLRTCLDEYLPAGLEAGLFFVT